MTEHDKPTRVAIKYCGCCNPYVDLTGIAPKLAEMAKARQDFVLVPVSENGIDVLVILCGCPRACGNKEEVKARARQHLIVAGESLNGKAIREEQLLAALQYELGEIVNRTGSRQLKD